MTPPDTPADADAREDADASEHRGPADKPRIVHVMHRLDRAGAELVAAQIARALRSEFDFAFYLLDGVGPLGAELSQEGFNVVDLGRTPGVDTALIRKLHNLLRAQRPDVVHAHQYTPFFYASTARYAGARPPILFTEHGRHYPDPRKLRRRLANRFLLRGADRITAVGDFVKRALVDCEGMRRDRIEVVYNAVDADRFAPPTDPAEHAALRLRARQAMRVDPEQPVAIQVARFHPVKDHGTALHAFAQVQDKLPGATLVLVGDGPERANLEALIDELEMAPHVRVLGVRADVDDLLPGADCFVLSSLSEGVSLTLLEAMAAGLPVAATDVGGNAEVVAHGETGLLSPRQDPDLLAYNLRLILRDRQLGASLGHTGQQRVAEQFSRQSMLDAYARLYRQMSDRPA
ncbi:MAG: glycosyltransferase [Planctomycetota bacterium]